MTKYALICDYKYCMGCWSCEIACRSELELPVNEWGIKITEFPLETIQGRQTWNFVPTLSHACDLCEARVAEGKKPACVHHCLSKCLELVPLEEVAARMEALGGGVMALIPQD